MSNSSACSILDMPDEILVKIILHFDARERLALANSCQRFNDLVFGDGELLRHLDFTREHQHTEALDILQYFDDENTHDKILSINAETICEVYGLSSSIGRATYLVELNILYGLHFDSVGELARFLKPLDHLKRLSLSWPKHDNPNCNSVLEESLSRLTYFSVQIELYSNGFLLILQLCQQLEELHMSIEYHNTSNKIPMGQELMALSNLKFVRLGISGDLAMLVDNLMSIVSDPAEWTNFYLVDSSFDAYLEKNVQVCEELGQIKEMPLPRRIAGFLGTSSFDMGWPLVPEHLLSEVIRIYYEDAPKKFCCLLSSQGSVDPPCTLEIDEAKKLLKDPGYQISYLRIWHPIHKNCDAHLLASAFPELTKLSLSFIVMLAPEKTETLHRCLRKIGSQAPEEDPDARNTDSSFKMLVENTPRLKVLEIGAQTLWTPHRGQDLRYWDLDALYLISGWKNLTVIRLCDVPITDAKFLIDIGKECKKLEEITLFYRHPEEGYSCELLKMLQHCRNLRKLSIWGLSLEHLSEMFNILSTCSRLAALRLRIHINDRDLELISSLSKMLRQCQELNELLINISSEETIDELRLAVDRIISKLNRPSLRFDEYSYCEWTPPFCALADRYDQRSASTS